MSSDREEASPTESDGNTTEDDDDNLIQTRTEVAGIYGPWIRKRRIQEIQRSGVLPLPPRIIGRTQDTVRNSDHCSCQRSSCLKLYCYCFAAGRCCQKSCRCEGCQNDETEENSEARKIAILKTLEEFPDAFRQGTIESDNAASRESKGPNTQIGWSFRRCSCKKSHCLKVRLVLCVCCLLLCRLLYLTKQA
jgi:hypothetical protein